MESGLSVTVLRGDLDWEIIYVDGEKVASQHANRLWPSTALDVVEGEYIESTNVIYDDDIFEHIEKGNIDEDEITVDPKDETAIWDYPTTLPEELY